MARRGHGEGSVSRRADGRWEAKVSLGYRGGKRLRKAFYGATRAEVQVKLREALKSRDDGLPIRTDDRLTVEKYLLRWYDAIEPNVRPGTARHWRWCMDHLIEGLGHFPLRQLQPSDVQRFLNREAKSVSTQSVHHFRACLRNALNAAMVDGAVVRNVASLARAPEVIRPDIRPFDAQQARVLMDHWREDQHGALYVTALLLGLRQGEALGLTWSAVDLDAGRVRITRTALGRTKTKASVRTVSIPPTLTAILHEHRDGQVRSIEGYVFPSRSGGPLDGSNVTHRFQAFLRRLGLPRIRFHDLRHTWATLLLERGVHAKIVQEAGGWASIAIVLDTYSHVTPRMSDSAAAEMEAAISG